MSGTRQSGSRKNSKNSASSNSKKNHNTVNQKNTRRTITQRDNGIWDEVALVAVLLVSIFLFVSNFGIGGTVGSFLSGVLFGCVGLFAYVCPLVVLLLVLFSLANRENLIATIKIVGAVLGCLALSAILHMMTMSKSDASDWKEIYAYCAENRTGGGLVGGLIANLLNTAFGTVGTYLVLLGILIICIVIVTERSFVGGMSRGSRKVYDSARQDMERRREAAQLKRERRREQQEQQKERQRIEKRVSGVSTDVTLLKKEEELPEEAKMPELETQTESRKFTFPIRKAEARRPEVPVLEEPEEILGGTGGLEEIGFNEDDLLKNALSRRELAAERQSRRITEPEPEPKFVPEPEVPVQEVPISETQPERLKAEPDRRTEPDARPAMPQAEPARQAEHEYRFPPVTLLKEPKAGASKNVQDVQLQETAQHLQQIMEDFGVRATVTDASRGPAVTRFEVQPAQGVKVSKILSLSDDIKLNLAVPDVRIEAPIPGKAAVGIEVPNKENSTVMFRELVESKEFQEHRSKIAFAVGKDIGGNIMVSDIAKMPHILIAGATGSGKSVCINTLIMSILYKARPDEVKLIMVDPKVVELSTYNGIPHLLIPVVTDPKKAAGALNWAVQEMMGRYNKFAELNVRNIEGYNSKIESIAEIEADGKPEKMPQIVIIVDELADLMMVSPGEVEDAICRLAQLARAAGIHLVIATQRPSVNVITGLIKANMPSRIAFAVSSGVDSRTILDMNGAEKLLGKGDMLFSPYGIPKPLRVQGAFVSDAEVSAVVEFLSGQNAGSDSSGEEIAEKMKQMQAAVDSASSPDSGNGGGSDRDVLFAEAGKFIIEKDKASIGMLQRWFKIGFNRAARIMDQLAEAGVVGEEEGTKPRKVLMTTEEFEQYLDEYV